MHPLASILALLVAFTPEIPKQALLLKSDASEIAGWRTVASYKFAARLSKNEDAAYAQVFRALDGQDEAKAKEAIAALASVTTVEGWGHMWRRCARWDHSLDRKIVPLEQRGCGLPVSIAALELVERTTGRPPEAIVLEVAHRIEPKEAQGLYAFARLIPSLWKKLGPLVAEARPGMVKHLGLRAFIARVDSDLATSQPEEYRKEASKLNAYQQAKDHKALLAYARSPKPMYLLRLLAAYNLAELGDGSALDLFEDRSYLAPGDGYLVRSSLENLLMEPPGPVRERAQALLELYSEARHPAEDAKLDATKP